MSDLPTLTAGTTDVESPYGAHSFYVTLDPADAYLPPAQAKMVPVMSHGAFAEVRGLGADLEVLAYPEGGVNDKLHQLPVRHSWGRITLRRGVVSDLALWRWYKAGLTQSLGARRDGSIVVLADDGSVSVSWSFRRGLAVKWTGPDLNAMQSAVAIDGIEIAHEGLDLVVGGGP